MANITTIRDNLKTRLESISGLKVYDTWPDGPPIPPCVIIDPAGGTFDETFGGSSAGSFHQFDLHLFVAGAQNTVAQNHLDPYLATSSTGGIYGAIQADQTLGGTVWATFCRGYREYGIKDLTDNISYWGVVFSVEVQTS